MSADTAGPTQPTPLTWTLRFKHARTTVLLHVDPLQSLPSLKAELLRALQQTQPDGTLNGQPLPTEAEEVVLGKPRDVNEPSKGWVRIGESATDAEDGAGEKKGTRGKGKGRAREVNGVESSVKGCGLRDNAVVAFKWGGSVEEKRRREREDDDEGFGVGDEDVEEEEWDVQIPRYEDTYGIEDLGEEEEEGGEEAG